MSLEWLEDVSISDLSEQPPDELLNLVDELAAIATATKARADKVNAAVALKYQTKAKSAYLAAGKDTGTVHLDDEGMDVEITTTKKVEWQQDKLKAVLNEMDAETAKHFAKATFAVDERKYLAATPDIQELFAPARTVKPGPMKITLKVKEVA